MTQAIKDASSKGTGYRRCIFFRHRVQNRHPCTARATIDTCSVFAKPRLQKKCPYMAWTTKDTSLPGTDYKMRLHKTCATKDASSYRSGYKRYVLTQNEISKIRPLSPFYLVFPIPCIFSSELIHFGRFAETISDGTW